MLASSHDHIKLQLNHRKINLENHLKTELNATPINKDIKKKPHRDWWEGRDVKQAGPIHVWWLRIRKHILAAEVPPAE